MNVGAAAPRIPTPEKCPYHDWVRRRSKRPLPLASSTTERATGCREALGSSPEGLAAEVLCW
jgi:hypothetical protein